MPSRTSPASAWLITYFAGFVVVCGMLLLTLFTQRPYGDLSRLGHVSEAEFGWRKPPPKVPPEQLQGTPIDQADILVIGDSFSMTHRWQSVLIRNGYTVATTFWGQYNDALCADFDAWLQRAGFRGRLVIIESVERLLSERMKKSSECQVTAGKLEAHNRPFLPPLEHLPTFEWNTGVPLTTGFATFRNTQKIKRTPDAVTADFRTIARPVKGGCQYFSNRLCEKALFFGEDDDNGPLARIEAERMASFDRQHGKVPLLWMVIPNKTTVYIDPAHSADFVSAFNGSGLGPDLFAFAAREKGRIMDFYFPNDTHLSMHGQLALGDLMLGEVRKRLPEPRPKGP